MCSTSCPYSLLLAEACWVKEIDNKPSSLETSFPTKTMYVSTWRISTSIEVSYQSRIEKIALLKRFVRAVLTGWLPKERKGQIECKEEEEDKGLPRQTVLHLYWVSSELRWGWNIHKKEAKISKENLFVIFILLTSYLLMILVDNKYTDTDTWGGSIFNGLPRLVLPLHLYNYILLFITWLLIYYADTDIVYDDLQTISIGFHQGTDSKIKYWRRGGGGQVITLGREERGVDELSV